MKDFSCCIISEYSNQTPNIDDFYHIIKDFIYNYNLKDFYIYANDKMFDFIVMTIKNIKPNNIKIFNLAHFCTFFFNNPNKIIKIIDVYNFISNFISMFCSYVLNISETTQSNSLLNTLFNKCSKDVKFII